MSADALHIKNDIMRIVAGTCISWSYGRWRTCHSLWWSD